MLIRHYTKPHWVKYILDTGYIDLEMNNTDEFCEQVIRDYYGEYRPRPLQSRLLDLQWAEAKGRQVWFTEEHKSNTGAYGFRECYFEFDSELIGAQKWHHFRKQFTSRTQQAVISELNRSAKRMGDDPYRWWVCTEPVPVSLARNTGALTDPLRWSRKELWWQEGMQLA